MSGCLAVQVIFAIPSMSRRFLASAMPIFMRILDRFQFLHPQTRELVRHVSMETNEWMTAFNFYLGVASLFDCLNNWLDIESSVFTCPLSDAFVIYEEICEEEAKEDPEQELESESGLGLGSGSGSGLVSDLGVNTSESILGDSHLISDEYHCSSTAKENSSSSSSSSSSSHLTAKILSLKQPTKSAEEALFSPEPLLKETWEHDVLPSVSSVLSMALKGVLDWQTEQVSPSDYLPWKLKSELPRDHSLQFRVSKEHSPHGTDLPSITSHFSFHLLLHRYLSSLVSECCKYSQHTQALVTLRDQLGFLDGGDDNRMVQAQASYSTSSSNAAMMTDMSSSLPLALTTENNYNGSRDGSSSIHSRSAPASASINADTHTSTNTSTSSAYQLTSLVDFPLRSSLLGSQVSVGMWRKNGVCMTDQLLNYMDIPYCKVFRDLDILLIQFCAVKYGSRRLICHILERYSVIDYVTTVGQKYSTYNDNISNTNCSDSANNSSSSSSSSCGRIGHNNIFLNRSSEESTHTANDMIPPVLPPIVENTTHITRPTVSTRVSTSQNDKQFYPGLLEESLLLLLNIVTDVPLPPNENLSIQSTETAKREIIHYLAGNNNNFSTFSQIQEYVNSCHNEFVKINPILLEKIINELADKKKNSIMEPPYFVLKKEMWLFYDPSYPHITSRMHQNAAEKRPKIIIPTPLCPAPQPCHSIFSSLRQSLLFEPFLLHCLRNILYAAAAAKVSHSAYMPVREHWKLKYGGVEFSRALHLLTITLHLMPAKATTPLTVDFTSTTTNTTNLSDNDNAAMFDPDAAADATAPVATSATTNILTKERVGEIKGESTEDERKLPHLLAKFVSFLLEEVTVTEEKIKTERTTIGMAGVNPGWGLDLGLIVGGNVDSPRVPLTRRLPHLLW